ncbi:Abi family protein [Corynebacterium sp. SCR221107]|uniref:Abi family protein n=1 Tax=Corynebacterium sp. SCR221107 TaxID=3017361 RepID=UPI0022EC89BD|nr:Abi family protein [Corynebacterium sp. SCR221107]WBT08467.1 Abi family protein [Corynebacterium sp. SCR221107]
MEQLKSRGMDCGEETKAYEYLERYGYYRLSGYWYPFRILDNPRVDDEGRERRLEEFEPGITLSRIVEIYEFDAELRSLLGRVLSSVEVAFRFFISHKIGKIDPFIHREPMLLGVGAYDANGDFMPSQAYKEWIEEYDRLERNAKGSFVQHFRAKYGDRLPVWVATEVMTFGALSQLFNLIPHTDRRTVADRLQIGTPNELGEIVGEVEVMSNWLNVFRHARNLCFHYSRMWNRVYDTILKVPGVASKDPSHVLASLTHARVSNRLYGLLLALRFVMLSVAPEDRQVLSLTWFVSRKCKELGLDVGDAGFPEGWESNPIWTETFRLDERPMLAGSLLDRIEAARSQEIHKLLDPEKFYPEGYPAEKMRENPPPRQMLKTYRKYGAAISFKLGGTRYYPVFQFHGGVVRERVAEINARLWRKCTATDETYQAASLLQWWSSANSTTASKEDGKALSPLEALEKGVLGSGGMESLFETFSESYPQRF